MKKRVFSILLAVVMLFGYRTYAVSYCIFPVIKKRVFDPYYQANPDADVEIRKRMNMTDEE